MKTIGILGGGQLARMLIESSCRYDFTFRVLSKEPMSPAGKLTRFEIIGDWDDEKALEEFSSGCDVITLENEFIDFNAIKFLEEKGNYIAPGSNVVRSIQDKLLQKETLKNTGVPVADFTRIDSVSDIKDFASLHGYPVILKSRTMGYDGKGNLKINSDAEVNNAFKQLSKRGELLAEKYIDFVLELAVQCSRSTNGELIIYPVVETIQKDHICHIVKASRDRFHYLRETVSDLCKTITEKLGYVGTMGIELFLLPNSELLVNELAPRVHNSGHYTIEGCKTSQFENHIRAILGYKLGDVELTVNSAVMINILGETDSTADYKGLDELVKMQNTYCHIYGKQLSKPGRKMGHITVTGENLENVTANAIEARAKLTI
jgi:5-(carboxyamino)imidazole ribonucleotide synthase